ncbi:MAG: ABC transporter ATP-binding protein [Armatimonadetes bacterium]|nr:ABC transporter ATP-binding protein [Armatimonadota bacterium]
MSGSAISAKDAVIRYGDLLAVDGVGLDVAPGEFVALVGPSGCGKTSILAALAGHIKLSSGFVERSGAARMVYQQDGLLPWMTVRENIMLALKNIRSKPEREERLSEMLELTDLKEFAKSFPHELSGGMRQRAELARALAGDCSVLLLDEPFSSLDCLTRIRLRHELAVILEKMPRAVLMVTHDVPEAVQLADRIILLSERPAQVVMEIKMNKPRPRELTDESVVGAVSQILTKLGLTGNHPALMGGAQ